ncbi:hypothetical protein SAMN02745121_06516 [Nannocystis exedens]|uniref:Uncharacterized protein n=1 Tax=Nannocystis exedens TaxID=54 RepID=A0A1I2F8Q7_9BACT|nr:hypothetical protein [Nannocystis exedens]PCC73022.1 hypothetical protein NAEX_06108 [Nannocystis exedens]SFF01329.1 hypothetical protein SAMN02745121_06516 [Nannocystis exedens]
MVAIPLALALIVGEPSPVSPPAEATATATEPRQIVVGVIEGGRLDAVAVVQALRGHLADLDVGPAVEARPAAALAEPLGWARERLAEGAFAVVWVEAAAGQGSAVYLLLGAPERLYTRHLDTPDDPLETREILGVVIRGLVASLAASEAPADMEVIAVPVPEERPPSPAPAPPPAPAAPPKPAPAPRLRLSLGLGYAGSSYAAQLPWGSGLGVELGVLGRRGLVVAVGGAGLLHPPLTPELGQQTRDDARLRLGRVGFTVRVGFRVPLGARRRFFVEPAVVGRGEAIVWRPTAGSQARGGAGLRVALAPTVGLGLQLGRGFALVLAAGLDLWLRNFDLVARTPVGTTPLVRPPTVGATAGLGLSWVR